ncbi:hypothetical protein V1503_07860 [Bacillus sp. SCS-151]
MNQIIEKLKIPGYKTKVVIKPRKGKNIKQNEGSQLSLEIDSE